MKDCHRRRVVTCVFSLRVETDSCADEGRLSSSECIVHWQTLTPQNVSEQRGRQFRFFWEKVPRHSSLLLVVASGDAHPVVEVCHNARRASLWRVWSVFLSHFPRMYSVSAWVALPAASFGVFSQYITIAVTSLCPASKVRQMFLPIFFAVWALQTCTLERPRKRPERGRKARNFGPPTLRGPTLRGPTLRGPHTSTENTQKKP